VAAICVTVRSQLEALVDGECADSRAGELRAHLVECASCRAHHAEASSLPHRLAAVGGPLPPPALVGEVLRRVRREHVGPLRLWGPLAMELVLCMVALWYVSGLDGLATLAQRTVGDAGALIGWDLGQADLPAPAAGDVFLLLVCGLLLATTIYHLSLLARQGQRLF
jgi:predicted anti-sigma-YlaC factor YlaD